MLYQRKEYPTHDSPFTILTVEDGVVVDSDAVQYGGNFRHSGRWGAQWIGKTEAEIKEAGFTPVPEEDINLS
jgi:hypothetical protein